MDINGCAEAHRESDFCVSDKRPYAKSNYNERRRRSILGRLTACASPSLGQCQLKKLDNEDSSSSIKTKTPGGCRGLRHKELQNEYLNYTVHTDPNKI